MTSQNYIYCTLLWSFANLWLRARGAAVTDRVLASPIRQCLRLARMLHETRQCLRLARGPRCCLAVSRVSVKWCEFRARRHFLCSRSGGGDGSGAEISLDPAERTIRRLYRRHSLAAYCVYPDRMSHNPDRVRTLCGFIIFARLDI